ncbi:MAG: ATP-binding protein, partial [Anaerolineae bacterium]
MALVEHLGSFYLGKEYDLAGKAVLDRPGNYDSRDLTTHAVCVGMTGSGKTGLCISLLEEAALDRVPAIIIDPKGDITNLLLAFPDLRPEDFEPWINADDAQRKSMTVPQYAAATAKQWSEGLAQWDEGPERIRLLKESAEFAIYTPGSTAGRQVSILSSFAAPSLDWEDEAEILRERVSGTVSALLGLVGVNADPLRSREHILLSNIVERAWRAGEDLDLAKIIMAVQKPPFRQLGVLDLDSFFPEKDRFALAMALNNIVAAPSFATWLEGEPLDVGRLFYNEGGKPRHSIFYIAHLSDAERMFFVTILLEQLIGWMRTQPGTTSLRAILYMDEVFGFFPPVAEPPSKRPMLTLLKQARAFGVGCVLTTQNPADLDYKGLTNAGTWFIGKLQAERDKARLMEGLENALAERGDATDPRVLDKLISSLDSRVFLLHDVHIGEPVIFHTRWAMSYLRGPLTRQQIRQLSGTQRVTAAAPPAAEPRAAAPRQSAAATVAPAVAAVAAGQPPMLPPDLRQVYLPPAETSPAGGGRAVARGSRLFYQPKVLGMASVRFVDNKFGLDQTQAYSLLLAPTSGPGTVSWADAEAVSLTADHLSDGPAEGAAFAEDVPEVANSAADLKTLERSLTEHLYRSQSYSLAYNSTLKLYAQAGESARDFRIRCQQAAREARDRAVDALQDKYEAKIEALQDRLARAERDLAGERSDYEGRKREETFSGLESVGGLLGLFGGRRRVTRAASVAATKRRLTDSARLDVQEAEGDVTKLKADIESLKQELVQEADALSRQWDAAVVDTQEKRVTPRKADVHVDMVAVAWTPS